MGIPLVRCPSCNVGLKATSPDGFSDGQLMTCPKCQTMFAAEAPPAVAKPATRKAGVVIDDEDDNDRPKKKRPRIEDDEDDRPKKKRRPIEDDRPRKTKKRKSDDGDEEREGFQYTKSPIRIVVISILFIILAVLSVLLYLKIKREREDNKSATPVSIDSAQGV